MRIVSNVFKQKYKRQRKYSYNIDIQIIIAIISKNFQVIISEKEDASLVEMLFYTMNYRKE